MAQMPPLQVQELGVSFCTFQQNQGNAALSSVSEKAELLHSLFAVGN